MKDTNNFKVEPISENKFKIFCLTKQAFFEYQKFRTVVESIYDFLSSYSSLSKDFYKMLSEFSSDILNYKDNYFIFDVKSSEEIVELLEFLISDKTKKMISCKINDEKTRNNFDKANQVIFTFVIILKELNNELKKTTKSTSSNS